MSNATLAWGPISKLRDVISAVPVSEVRHTTGARSAHGAGTRNSVPSGESAGAERYATILSSVDTLSHLAQVGQQPDHRFTAAPGRDVAGIAGVVPEEQGPYSWGAQPRLGLRDVARGCAIAAQSHVPSRYKRCIEADEETEESDHRTGAEILE